DDQRRSLEEALRQCDGHRVQVLLLVRDEFWMDLTRFLWALEVRLVEGGNSAAVDLFDLDHARRVLLALGRAHRRLALPPHELSTDHEAFLDQALAGLARDDRVVCVRLVLLAELLRAKPWVPETLHTLGGVERIGVMILDEAFSAASADPRNRAHRRAAREVLARLVPARGVAIKGHMIARERLLEASGYAAQPQDFDELMWTLDHQLRVITPADPAGRSDDASSQDGRPRFYQLTHDYLIPDLRAWLLRDRQQTLRGRAELRLQEFAVLWSDDRKATFLPTTWEWVVLVLLTARRRWTAAEKSMMRAATMRQLKKGAVLAAAVATIGLFGVWKYQEFQARSLVASLRTAGIDQVPRLVGDMHQYRRWAVPMLREELADKPASLRSVLPARLALLDSDPSQAEILADRMIDPEASSAVVLTIRDALRPERERVVGRLWRALEDVSRPPASRLRAAMALADFAPPTPVEGGRWTGVASATAENLVRVLDESPSDYAPFVGAIAPARGQLLSGLTAMFRNPDDRRHSLVTNLLVDLARDDPTAVAELAMSSDPDGFAKFFPLIQRHRTTLLPRFREIAAKSMVNASEEESIRLSRRRALAAVALIRLGEPDAAWPVYRVEPDPNARSFLIHRGDRYGVHLRALLDRLDLGADLAAVRGLLLAVGRHADLRGSATRARAIGGRFLASPDAGALAAAEWMLRQLPGDPPPALRPTPYAPGRSWYVTDKGHVMIVIDARHVPGINRAYAIASKETSINQMRRFRPDYWFEPTKYESPGDGPAGVVKWSGAIDYCQWLNREEKVPDDQSCYPVDERDRHDRLPVADTAKPGYRPPTKAEFEYACRAMTRTRRFFGDDLDLIAAYARFG
ncbi:MAG: serine/threonine protein kinase, partial [Actinomycetia bacterium]|nr:serine/threonine protein kinase [Actinomycetes bacterium]